MSVKVIIVAAGSGKRIRGDMPKQYILLAGLPLLAHTALKFQKSVLVDEIILVVRKDDLGWVRDNILASNNLTKVTKVVGGGAERQDSVACGLQEIYDSSRGDDIVIVHDGARPFVDKKKIEESINEAKKRGACILGLRIRETLKNVDKNGIIKGTMPSKDLWIAQTPQAFKLSLIKEAYLLAKKQGFYGTDEASLVERLPHDIKVIEGSFWNIKITYPEDLQLAEHFIKTGIFE
ncbi:MAG: 2-C-methyl-D-erythritol 4-phosphate cytidylyltransferase [bacterium]